MTILTRPGLFCSWFFMISLIQGECHFNGEGVSHSGQSRIDSPFLLTQTLHRHRHGHLVTLLLAAVNNSLPPDKLMGRVTRSRLLKSACCGPPFCCPWLLLQGNAEWKNSRSIAFSFLILLAPLPSSRLRTIFCGLFLARPAFANSHLSLSDRPSFHLKKEVRSEP